MTLYHRMININILQTLEGKKKLNVTTRKGKKAIFMSLFNYNNIVVERKQLGMLLATSQDIVPKI